MSNETESVRFESAEDGGVNLVFPNELLDTLGIDSTHEVEVTVYQTLTDGRLETTFSIDFGVEMTPEVEHKLTEYLSDSDANITFES